MSRPDLERLSDALQHCRHALALAQDVTPGELAADRARLQALLYDLIVLGTTTGKLSPEVKELDPALPWRDIVATRNRIVHAYWQVDVQFIATVVEADLPEAAAKLAHLLALLQEGAV